VGLIPETLYPKLFRFNPTKIDLLLPRVLHWGKKKFLSFAILVFLENEKTLAPTVTP